MEKKHLQFLILLLSVLAGILAIALVSGRYRFSGCLTEPDGFADVIRNREESPGLVTKLVFNEESLFHDTETNTWYYSLREGDRRACDPSISVVSRDGERPGLMIAGGEISEESIRDGIEWKLLFYTDRYFEQAALVCTTLPLMQLETDGEIPDNSDEVVGMRLSLYDNGQKSVRRQIFSDGILHIRGKSTLDDPKKSYRISLRQTSMGQNTRNNDLSLLGMRKDDDWILYSAGNDPSMVRNVFSTNLWTAGCGTDNAGQVQTGVKYRYLELLVNGRYAGLYALGYPIQEGQFSIGSDPMESALYKIYAYGDCNHLYLGPDGSVVGHEPVGDGKEDADRWALLRDYYLQLGENSGDNDRLWQGIDPDNAADFWLFINLIQGMDNLDNNHYLALQRETEGIRALYAPWDMDATWGNDYRGNRDFSTEENFVPHNGCLYQLLVNGDPAARELILQKYHDLRSQAWSDASLAAMLTEIEQALYASGAYARDAARWPENPHSADAWEEFCSHVTGRFAFVDQWIGQGAWDCTQEYPVQFEMDLLTDLDEKVDFDEEDDETAWFFLEIVNHAVWEDDYYGSFYERFGIPAAYQASNAQRTAEKIAVLEPDEPLTLGADAVFWKPGQPPAEVIRSLRTSGSGKGLSAGTVVFYGDADGDYGIYLDGHELISANGADPEAPDIRLIDWFPDKEEARISLEWKY